MSVISYMGRIDPKGRITIPIAIRDLLGLYEGATITIQVDLDTRSITIKPHHVPGLLIRVSTECDNRSCIGNMVSWIEGLEGFKDILEVRCYRGGKAYKCYSIVSIAPKAVEKIKGVGRYRVEVIKEKEPVTIA
ncbi:MAG: hypothetical protein RQ885_01725 [Desulfurococcales archaeon]|jgi:AbrB family looped-hinge helix DNA binding protein|nr:hypothetical protein [Desulfurococcales archaeon]